MQVLRCVRSLLPEGPTAAHPIVGEATGPLVDWGLRLGNVYTGGLRVEHRRGCGKGQHMMQGDAQTNVPM